MKCPFCGRDTQERICPGCGQRLEGFYALSAMAVRLYNEGLAFAREFRLEHAREKLELAIQYDASLVAAHNLLGLIYDQVGEIGLAAAQWEVSAGLDPEPSSNPGVEYLRRVRRSAAAEQMREGIRHYNQALIQLGTDQQDSGLLHLKKAVQQNSHLVKARELLAVYFMSQKDLIRAQQMLESIAAINPEEPELPHLQRLLTEVRSEASRLRTPGYVEDNAVELAMPGAEAEELGEAGAAGQIMGQRRSLMTALRQNQTLTQMLLFIAGIAIGLLFMRFLILPQQTLDMRHQVTDLEYRMNLLQEERDSTSASLEDIQKELAALTASYSGLREEYADYSANTSALLRAVSYYQQGNRALIREELGKVRTDILTVEQRVIYDWLNTSLQQNTAQNGGR
ncbi:MAG: hypothetical protein IJM90_01795 [Firmicutes bacterium]|nr:hypothetical protein [Bacillota bacterium]